MSKLVILRTIRIPSSATEAVERRGTEGTNVPGSRAIWGPEKLGHGINNTKIRKNLEITRQQFNYYFIYFWFSRTHFRNLATLVHVSSWTKFLSNEIYKLRRFVSVIGSEECYFRQSGRYTCQLKNSCALHANPWSRSSEIVSGTHTHPQHCPRRITTYKTFETSL